MRNETLQKPHDLVDGISLVFVRQTCDLQVGIFEKRVLPFTTYIHETFLIMQD